MRFNRRFSCLGLAFFLIMLFPFETHSQTGLHKNELGFSLAGLIETRYSRLLWRNTRLELAAGISLEDVISGDLQDLTIQLNILRRIGSWQKPRFALFGRGGLGLFKARGGETGVPLSILGILPPAQRDKVRGHGPGGDLAAFPGRTTSPVLSLGLALQYHFQSWIASRIDAYVLEDFRKSDETFGVVRINYLSRWYGSLGISLLF